MRRRLSPPGPRDSGYTLLEMLVALVVFGLIMAGIAQTFRFGLTAWSATTRNTTRPEGLAAMNAAVTLMITQAVPDSMTGVRDQIAFTTKLPAGAGLPGALADVSIMVTSDDGLVMRFRPHPAGVPLAPAPVPQVEALAQGVTSLNVSYLVSKSGTSPVWSNSWSGYGLPLLVRFHFQFADGGSWPDLVAAPINTGN